MPDRRALFGAGLLSLALASILPPESIAATERLAFRSPTEADILLGETTFAFDVVPGEPEVERIDVYVGGRLIGSALPPGWFLVWDAPAGLSDSEILAVAFAEGEVVGRVVLETRRVVIQQDVEVSLVQLYPVVFDRRGRYVDGLQRDDFVVLDQGEPIELRHFSERTVTSNVALLLDTSQSMEAKLGVVRDASIHFVDQIGEGHKLSLYAFHQTTVPLLEQVDDSRRVQEAIRTLRAGGGTALYDAVLHVLQRMRDLSGRRVIVLFSDGRDERSVSSLERVTRLANESGVIVYTVGTLRKGSSPKSRADLTELADGTGGEPFFIARAADLESVFEEVVRDLESQYVLSYPIPAGASGLRSVEVRPREKGHRVRCRREYHAGR